MRLSSTITPERSGTIFGTCILLALLCAAAPAWASEGNIDPNNKYAWSENAGWLNFRPTDGGVTIYSDHLEGYTWAENIGWIKLGSHTGGGAHTYANTDASNWGVNRSGTTLSGFAWSENAGWINFAPTDGGVTINTTTGDLDGYAWAENVGWIHFNNPSVPYKVVCTSPTLVELMFFKATGWPEHVRLEWQTGSELDTAGFHLWRAVLPSGRFARITDSLIPAEGSASTGASYSYPDYDVALGGSYQYKLEDVDLSGVGTLHGPVKASVGGITLVSPERGARVSGNRAVQFDWESVPYDRFRIEFSKRADFTSKALILPARRANGQRGWLKEPPYTPTKAEWARIKKIAARNGVVYWRVLGKAGSGGKQTSEASRLIVENK
jgi:hypothetical protein